jgi:cysteine desulfurase/selenocysteine lyase
MVSTTIEDVEQILDVDAIRAQFPLLDQRQNGKPLVYLDSAATMQKPQSVIDTITQYYQTTNANVHRGIYHLSQCATDDYDAAREKARQFINAKSSDEIIFTRGTTESINLVATSFSERFISRGDEVIISTMEHHSNIVPWQLMCKRVGAILKVLPVFDDGTLDIDALDIMINEKTKLLSIVHVSNVLGTINPVDVLIAKAHKHGVPVLVDGAQAVVHQSVDVQALDCDFYVFSAHKLYGPTGAGVLYGKKELLDKMPPYQGGGDMIRQVTFEKTEYADLPLKFEAGTPNIAGVIGLGAAIDFVRLIGIDNIKAHEQSLLHYATAKLAQIAGLHIIGPKTNKAGVISFVMDQAHPHDIATILDTENIAVRAGHHCAMPLINRLGLSATARISFGVYNTRFDVDCAVEGLKKVLELFGE